MNYYLDTEFHEYKKPMRDWKWNRVETDTIELISIGIVEEGACRNYYAICNEFDVKAAWDNEWLRENVLMDLFYEYAQKEFYRNKNTTLEGCLIGDVDYVTREVFGDVEQLSGNWRAFRRLVRKYGKSRKVIAQEIKEFIYGGFNGIYSTIEASVKEEPINFFAYYADYDWVVFCWLFGRMIDLPKGFPMYCNDLKQMLEVKAPRGKYLCKLKHGDAYILIKNHFLYPKQNNEHNALDDAEWNRKLHKFIEQI